MFKHLSSKSKTKLVFPMNFTHENHYSLKITSLNSETLMGFFTLRQANSYKEYPIKCFVYQSIKNLYHFTFNIDWEYFHSKAFTLFSADLNIDEATIDLKWLLKADNSSKENSVFRGKAQLKLEEIIVSNPFIDTLPYPVETTPVLEILTE